MGNYEVSVIVCCYNPDISKLKKTIKSIIMQKGIVFELIVSDDGSKNFPREQIEVFLKENSFSDYKIVISESNRGTVHNCYQGASKAEGTYLKTISPGDYIYAEYSLKNTIDFMRGNDVKVCFSDAVYYSIENGELSIHEVVNAPRHPESFSLPTNKSLLREQYITFNDVIIGASIYVKTDTFVEYLPMLLNKVIYTEDEVFRLMALKDIWPVYFPQITIWYEYGSGVSTTKDKKWIDRMKKDVSESRKILMMNINGNSWFEKRLKLALKLNDYSYVRLIIKAVLFPIGFLKELKRLRSNSLSHIKNLDKTFFINCD